MRVLVDSRSIALIMTCLMNVGFSFAHETVSGENHPPFDATEPNAQYVLNGPTLANTDSGGPIPDVLRFHMPKQKKNRKAQGHAVFGKQEISSTHLSWFPKAGTGSHITVSGDSVQAEWVRHFSSQQTSGDDFATAIAIAASGCIYVTGSSLRSPNSLDYLTMKLDSAGSILWISRYNGPGSGDDRAVAIALDGLGHVYVTGGSAGSGTSSDYATVKYTPDGVEEWVARYNGPGNGWDHASAIVVDSQGNAYVTGYSAGTGTSYDYATIKYNSSGITEWVVRYDGPSHIEDRAEAIAVDELGNVYVTGSSFGSGTADYATIKYTNDGVERWVARYNGTGNGHDGATALALDALGNVFVTGHSPGLGTNFDYATLKYDSVGTQEWVVRYNGPGYFDDFAQAILLDQMGNVYVTGVSPGPGTSGDYATVKYNSAGFEQWVARYNSPTNNWDAPTALAVDDLGNVYVTGQSIGVGTERDYATIKYDSSGSEQWVARYNGPGNGADFASGLVLDPRGNVYVTGWSVGSGTSKDFATIKYNSAGTEQWALRYDGPGNGWDQATALAIDASGNVYVAGFSGSYPNHDYTSVKYNHAGEQQWVAHYNGPDNSRDQAVGIGLDALGNIYVTGGSVGPGRSIDYATIKYSEDGVELWSSRYNGPENSHDEPSAIAVDADGNVYVAGYSGILPQVDYITVKYDSGGAEEWTARYSGQGDFADRAIAVAVDGEGNVYVTGQSMETSNDYCTVKYGSDGTEQWVARYNGPSDAADAATALAVDNFGNVYVTGWSSESGTLRDYVTVKYNSEGIEQWAARYNGPDNSWDEASAIAVDTIGNVYVTGKSYSVGASFDYATVKYNSAGIEQWVARYNGPGNASDEAKTLALDGLGNLYVTGLSFGSANNSDYATIKYNANGVAQWVARYSGPRNSFDQSTALAVDALGNVYVTGWSVQGTEWSVFTTIKYAQIPVSVRQEMDGLPDAFVLHQNYPNPFNPATILAFDIPHSAPVTLTVFDLLGRKVASLVDKEMNAGSYTLKWDAQGNASGVYICQLRSGNHVTTRKLLLLR